MTAELASDFRRHVVNMGASYSASVNDEVEVAAQAALRGDMAAVAFLVDTSDDPRLVAQCAVRAFAFALVDFLGYEGAQQAIESNRRNRAALGGGGDL